MKLVKGRTLASFAALIAGAIADGCPKTLRAGFKASS